MSAIKNRLIHNDAFELILSESQASSKSISNICTTNNNNNTQLLSFDSINDASITSSTTSKLLQQELLLKELDEIKCAFHIRPYCAQIEHTKSNLFAYFVIKFDIIYHNYATLTTTNNNTTPKIAVTSAKTNNTNCILNCLKILYDSIDGHSILIENSHKILDIDLSEWTLRREIYNDFPLNSSLKTTTTKLTSDLVVEYKFPKGFKLKRRKKINLIAAGKVANLGNNNNNNTVKSISAQNSSKLNNSKFSISCNSLNGDANVSKEAFKRPPIKPSYSSLSLNPPFITSSNSVYSPPPPSIATNGNISSSSSSNEMGNKKVAAEKSTKCACCACKTMVTRKGDVEFFEVKEISNWGSGILVMTRLINNKNVTKMVNYKYLKHIWVNNHEKKFDEET